MLAYNSNKIEGSKLSPEQTSSIFSTGTIGEDGVTFRVKDIEETTGHFIMFNNMLKSYKKDLSKERIKTFHYDLKCNVFDDIMNGYNIGQWKSRKNIVGNITTTLPEDVDKEMDKLLEWYSKKEKNLKTIGEFHKRFERIHPFQDGNGRVGRIIIFRECIKNNIIPPIIIDEYKGEYYNCLKDKSDFTEFLEKMMEEYYNSIKDFIFDYSCNNDN